MKLIFCNTYWILHRKSHPNWTSLMLPCYAVPVCVYRHVTDVLPMSIPCMLANLPHRPHYYLLVHWIHHYCVILQVSVIDVCVCVGACLYVCACICVSPCVCVHVHVCVYLLLSVSITQFISCTLSAPLLLFRCCLPPKSSGRGPGLVMPRVSSRWDCAGPNL